MLIFNILRLKIYDLTLHHNQQILYEMQTVTVSDKAAAFIEECRDFHTANTIKAGIADVFAFALSESTAIKLDPDAIVGLETLSRLADMVNEFARNDIAE